MACDEWRIEMSGLTYQEMRNEKERGEDVGEGIAIIGLPVPSGR